MIVVRNNMALAAVLALPAIGLALAACSSTPSAPRPSASPPSPPASGTATLAPLSAIRLELKPLVEGFEQPLFLTHSGDGSGRLFVVEQTGRIWVVRDGRKAGSPFLDVSGKISTGGERGLLGLAFAPDFSRSGDFYVDYTDTKGNTVVERYTAQDPASDSPKIASTQALLHVVQPYPNHNGGCIMFEPDGQLWVGMGDGGSEGDPQNRAQDPHELLGKVLSLDVSQANPSPRIVITGVRNPWRYSFDRKTGDLWLADVGQDLWEEIDHLPKGAWDGVNLGWNKWEGEHPYPPGSQQSRSGFTFPVAEYSHDKGESITGGYVYRGSRYPELEGVYLYADYVDGWVGGLRLSVDGSVAQNVVLLQSAGNPSSFGEDESGELYLVDYRGSIYRLAVAR